MPESMQIVGIIAPNPFLNRFFGLGKIHELLQNNIFCSFVDPIGWIPEYVSVRGSHLYVKHGLIDSISEASELPQ